MNSVSLSWIASARKASLALVALLPVVAGCDKDDGTGSDTDTAANTDSTDATTNNNTMTAPTTTDGTDTTGDTDDTDTAPTTTGGPIDVDYETDIQTIWDASCTTGCHTAGGTAASWFVITPGGSHDALVGKNALELQTMQLIAPGDREASYLWHKINNTHIDVGGSGTPMPPPPAAALSSDELAKIGAWIDAGANP